MNKSLYLIQNEYLQLADLLIESGGEITEETETLLQINKEELTVKASNFALLSREIEHKTEAIDSEIKRLTGLKKSYSNSADRIKERIKSAMELFGIEKIESDLVRLSFRKSESVEVEDEELISDEYKNTKEVVTVDKVKLKAALKEGSIILGAELKTNNNLQIK